MGNKIKQLEIREITYHPQNPRKDLGDLTELTESIRIHGIMQNLIVMEKDEMLKGIRAEYEKTPSQIYARTMEAIENKKSAKYVVLLGHRRLEAASLADLDTVPCVIYKDLTLNEQISLMLLENMQRNSLTIIEEAEGFQMMLDLGGTVKTVAEKSGFSQSTVRHRVELAKLDRKRLKKLMDNRYQITITDLAYLEKVDSVNDRDDILKRSDTGGEIKRRVENYIRDKKRKEQKQKTIEALEKLTGKKPAKEPKGYHKWSHEWQTLIEIEEGEDPEKTLKSKKYKEIVENLPDDVFVSGSYGYIIIAAKRRKTKTVLTQEEKERKEKDKRIKELRKLRKAMLTEWEEWLLGVMDSTGHSDKNNLDTLKGAINLAEQVGIYIGDNAFLSHFGKKELWKMSDEERTEARNRSETAPACAKMLYHICEKMEKMETWNWQGFYAGDENAKNHANELCELFDLMENYGYRETTDEYVEFIGGAHELFVKKEK